MVNKFAFLLLGVLLTSCVIHNNPEYSKLSSLDQKEIPIELGDSLVDFNKEKIRVVTIFQFDSILSKINCDTLIVFTGVLNCKSGLRDVKYIYNKYTNANTRVVLLGIDDWYWAGSILKKYEKYNLDIYLLNDFGRTNLLSTAQFVSNHYNFLVKEKYSQLRLIGFNKKHQVILKLAQIE